MSGEKVLAELRCEFQWLRPEQKAALLREAPDLYLAVARYVRSYEARQRSRR